MTEEEFKALLKIRGDGYELVVKEKVIYEAFLQSPIGTVSMERWASSEDKEMALDTLAEKFFGGNSANTGK
jgi:hypothetical protein